MRISTNAFFNLDDLMYSKNELSYPWNNVNFTKSGSDALVCALLKLNVKKGSGIGVPAYICSSITQSLKNCGFIPILIDIEKSLLISKEKINELFDKNIIKVIILVEYFGYLTNEVDSLAQSIKRTNRVVIIDKCHSAFSECSNDNPKTYVDAIFYSYRKSIRICEEGGFSITNEQYKNTEKIKKKIRFNEIKLLVKNYIELILIRLPLLNMYSNFTYKVRSILHNKKKLSSTSLKISTIIGFILFSILSNQEKILKIKKKRQNNFNYLVDTIENIKQSKFNIVFNSLSKNEIPQSFPILDKNEKLVEYLRSKGISSYKWPDKELPAEVIENPMKFKNANYFNKKIACLPLHQSISKKQLNYIYKIINSYLKI